MLALIAGQGRLPVLLAQTLVAQGADFQIFQLAGFEAENPTGRSIQSFCIEELGSFLKNLMAGGFTTVCFAGAIQRPTIDPARIDAETLPLVGRIDAAIRSGDDGALRIIIALFEEQGLRVRSAQDIRPDLLPPAGILSPVQPTQDHRRDVHIALGVLARQGRDDLGQACIVQAGRVLAQEGQDGTDAMLAQLPPQNGGILFKGPKPTQDRRADLPTIGVGTVQAVARAGLDGIVTVAGGVLVLDLPEVLAECEKSGLFLWNRGGT